MASILDRLRGVLKRATNSTADLASALDDARRAEVDAVAAVEKQSTLVAAGFLDDDAKRAKDRNALEDLRLKASDAAAIRGALEERHAVALAADENGRRQAVYADAKVKGDAAALALSKSYPKLAAGIVAMLKDLAEAQQAVALANAELPEGAVPLVDPETSARGTPGLPRENVTEEVVELWSRVDMTTPVDAEFQDGIYSLDKHGEPSGWGRRPEDLDPCFRLRRYRKLTFRERQNGDYPKPLATGIRLPAVRGDGMLWGNAFLMHDPALSAALAGEGEPHNVLARVADIEAAAAARPVKAERPLKIEWELIGDVVPLPNTERVNTDPSRRARTTGNVKFGSSPMNLPARAGGRR